MLGRFATPSAGDLPQPGMNPGLCYRQILLSGKLTGRLVSQFCNAEDLGLMLGRKIPGEK